MSSEFNGEELVPDFILGDPLVKALSLEDNKECVAYTLEQKPGKTEVLGLKGNSSVNYSKELPKFKSAEESEVWFAEEIEKRRKESRMYNTIATVTMVVLFLLVMVLAVLM